MCNNEYSSVLSAAQVYIPAAIRDLRQVWWTSNSNQSAEYYVQQETRAHLSDGGVAGKAVGGVAQGNHGGACGDGDHAAPLGEAGAGLVVLGGALREAVEALAPGLVVAVDQGDQTLVDLDACSARRRPSRRSVLQVARAVHACPQDALEGGQAQRDRKRAI